MDSAVVILVIVVSAALVFLLVLSIILAIILIRISRRIKNIADNRADMIANHTNATVVNISKVTNAINLIKLIVATINIFSKNKTRSRRG